MQARTFAILTSLGILLYIIELIRRQKMTFKYSLFWMASGALVLFLSFNDQLLKIISDFFGFKLLSNFVFFLMLVFFVILCLMLTIYINEQNSRSEKLAQSVGVLEYKLRQFEKQLSGQNKKDR